MADPRAPAAAPPGKVVVRTLQTMFSDSVADKKLLIMGPGPEKLQDSRFTVGDAHADHVVIKLLGDEQLIIPYSTILTVKLDRTQITIRLR
jgi:hypothetical protein